MKIFCVGRNYADHAKELGNAVPEEPVIFMKPKTALLQPNTPFYYPQFSNELHYEVELILRIAKNGKYIPENQASKYYDAISVGIDFTARDVQANLKKKGLPWEKAKAWDNSAVAGNWILLSNEMLANPIHFSLNKNGEQVQIGDTRDMIFSFDHIVSHISQYFSLNIGDMIYTGTPAGVGECVSGDVLTGYLETQKMFELEIK
ncbi:MAG TPA: fumarylacetoacetate hydrolase family protein [Sediminibacterium sp.]|uniref:fumarylacetoacetate hydrolase family protein n=1 Tax=Sediminibacterium sp. TaxID=1917865 RepID=UPI0008C79681|nr:fumarylacetoacetate hydrolase family protein [Sediminibacterium sp.]OHC86943.1 MAG: 2-hydroxyhepta-2,4-diene-1,7-dioate isomerase [Sphingobacteriia bacterium RIFOXYC2_FULL_35_18]OHC88201.1 MAG: 2-hydroxyhepta-2,4-diene-1,7-dioate isomerase [Sphingobacteriia bacterium RIFOXYD2_FULL_35_12]HLD51668.1 fumarylacetoacetate hydrolase family protein [Sediminibacterium sp.]